MLMLHAGGEPLHMCSKSSTLHVSGCLLSSNQLRVFCKMVKNCLAGLQVTRGCSLTAFGVAGAAKESATPPCEVAQHFEQPEKSEQESYSAYMPKGSLQTPADRQHSGSKQTESLGIKSEEPPPEQFGNGRLVRPKVSAVSSPSL